MKFYEALRMCVEEGKRIRRACWSSDVFVYLRDDDLVLSTRHRPYGCWSVDSLADDWEVVKTKVEKTRTVWINCYKDSNGMCHSLKEDADNIRKSSDFLFTKEFTFEWEEEV